MNINSEVKKLCKKLDHLVEQAESCGKQTKARRDLLAEADTVRERIRMLDH